MDQPALTPARIPNNPQRKVMWGALAVVALSLFSVTMTNRMMGSQKADLTMYPVTPTEEVLINDTNPTEEPSEKSQACQKLDQLFCQNVNAGDICLLVKQACRSTQ